MIGLPGGLERAFGVDDPLFPGEFPGEASELHRVCQTWSWALQPALLISLLEALQKQPVGDMGVTLGGADGTVAQEDLQNADVDRLVLEGMQLGDLSITWIMQSLSAS
jgi:hypothetical protein